MSDETNETQSGQSETQSDDAPPSSGPDSGQRQAAETAEAEQVRQQNQQLKQQVQQYEQAIQQYLSQQQAAQNSQQQANQVNYDELEDEWLTSPGKASQKLSQNIQQNVLSQVQQMAQPLMQNQTQTAKAVAQQDAETKEIFDRYGHEVEQYVANVAPQYKANPELWKKAAQMVKADHLDEFVQEKAQEMAASAASQSETGATGQGGRSSPSMREELKDKLESSSYGRKLLGKYGADGLRQHVNRVKDQLGVSSFEEYVDMVADTDVVADPDAPNQWKNKNLGR